MGCFYNFRTTALFIQPFLAKVLYQQYTFLIFNCLCYTIIMSMFREHWLGALTTYSTFFIISFVATIAVSILYGSPFDWNPTISMDPVEILGCFIVALLFGLWPDVDIASKSQKIFYSALFVLNASLILLFQMYLAAALLGLFAMLPILSKHRGWTHSKFTMILLPSLFLVIPIYVEYTNLGIGWEELPDLFDSLVAWDSFPESFRYGLAYYVAGLIGYATHLHLDGILFRSRKSQRRKVRANQ